MDITWDRETTGLLDESAIDYTASPYKLKEVFKTHCIVVEEHQTGRIVAFYDGDKYELDGREYNESIDGCTYKLTDYSPIEYTHLPRKEFKRYILSIGVENVIAHNQINFDLLVGKLEDGMDYEIEDDLWCGIPVNFEDTLVISKTQNPDRFGGHSLDALSEKTGIRKINFRSSMKGDSKFKHFAADMLYYCIKDVLANTAVYKWLKSEAGGWNWKDAISLEKSVAWIITRQEHRGFWFNKELAESNIEELDKLLEERRQRAEPVLPAKTPTQAFLKTVTPPARQFLKAGGYSEDIKKFVAKHEGKLFDETEPTLRVELFGKVYDLPLARDPLITSVPATLDDSTHIKNWLVGLGWIPSEYKEKDLSVRQVKGLGKVKRTREEFEKAVEDYVEQTLASNFCEDRCEFLEVRPNQLKAKLLKTKEGSSCKVLTNPNFTKGQEKEICPNLEEMAEKFPFARDVVEYLTYKHRRNSILGGGLEWDEEEEAEKGYLAYVRQDGRIPTPADTCGAATSRFKHKVVANIPRVTSLYGGNMRALFGVNTKEYFQIGYDFDSLEAKMESSYCWRYDATKEYCNSLTMDKPNDVHTLLAKRISEIIRKEFTRTPAKSCKYGITYGATEKKVMKIIGSDINTATQVFNGFWEAAFPLKGLKEALKRYWETAGGKKFILGIDGRKVPTRSAHAILNSLFQSAGVICAKRAMVIHDKLLRSEGFGVDFFKDDWRNKQFCQQLIAYHDESQLEVSKSLVKFKTFPTKEECQAFKDNQDTIWSDIKESPKGGFYVGYSRAGELAALAVQQAGDYYKLNVPLTAGYVIGHNWKMCH